MTRQRGTVRTGLAVAAALWLLAAGVTSGQFAHPSLLRNHPAIAYSRSTSSDAIAKLNARLASGETTLQFEPVTGYLTSVLTALQVPAESQVLVFSKTSFQASHINPRNPRAIFFNDHASVGFVRGAPVLEFVAQDARLGSVFYTLDQKPGGVPKFERNDVCVMCHASDATHNVPGLFVGSVFPGPDGITLYGPAYTTDHRSPFELRWGGWYVTGTHRAERHMGNAVATNPSDLAAMVTPETVHVTSLDSRFDPNGYPQRSSDLIALMVLEHQATMSNLITRVGWEARVGTEAGRPLAVAAAELVDYLLFVDETPMPGPVTGTSDFARRFVSSGPRDRQGRSLRELDLDRRLMRYPCSYLIYSEAFDAMPAAARDAVYQRMWEILSGTDTAPRYAVLSPADRRAILEILRDTKADLPPYFREPTPDTSATRQRPDAPRSAGAAAPTAG